MEKKFLYGIIIFLLLLILFSGCLDEKNNDTFKEVPYEGQLEGEYIEIQYSRVNGFVGTGNALEFYNDGKVTSTVYESIYSGEAKQTDTKIERTKLENLAFQIQQNGFFELEDSYDCTKECLTDQSDAEFTVIIGNKTKTVKEYSEYGPKVLRHIENLIKNYNQ